VRSGPWDDEVVHLATEALSNALRHSRAANVEIDVTQDDSGLTLDVADDGVGFDVTETGAGMGLANMRARALALGGSVEIDSEPGRGTRVRARLPFRPSEYPD
jgi:signal transduction histidine kinase